MGRKADQRRKAKRKKAREVAVIREVVQLVFETSDARSNVEARPEVETVAFIGAVHAGESARRAGSPHRFGRAVLRSYSGDIRAVAVLFRAAPGGSYRRDKNGTEKTNPSIAEGLWY
jgi:hypothetical protein